MVAIDVGSDLVARLREAAPDVAFVALHGRGGEDGTVQELLEVLGIPYTGSGVACLHALRRQDAGEARAARRRLPTPDWVALGQIAFHELGAAEALRERSTSGLGFPLVVKPVSQGSALGVKFAHTAAELPAALIAALSYGTRGAARAPRRGPRAGGLDDRGERRRRRRRCRSSRRCRMSEEFYDFAARYEIGRTDFVCPAELEPDVAERVREIALGAGSCSAAAGSRAST